MITDFRFRPTRHAVAALCVGAAAALLGTTSALAGECPKDQVLAQPREIEEKPSIGIKRESLSVVKLEGWRGVGDLYLRTRRLTIAVDGIIPTHQHDDRPSIVYILSGELIEHSSLCKVPITHKAGEWSPEFGPGHAHWWENKTSREVVVLSSDVIPPEAFDPAANADM